MDYLTYWDSLIKIIQNEAKNYWIKYILNNKYNEEEFKKFFVSPRNTFIKYCKENFLNCSSIAGTILEWTFTQFLIAGVDLLKKDTIVDVINGHQIPFKWKTSKNKKLNLDIVIKNKKTSKLYYAFEIKTAFEDNFSKYREEEKIIYHQREKAFPNFKYYYISIDKIPKILIEKNKRDIATLINRKELYLIDSFYSKETSIEMLLKNIVTDIMEIK